MQSFTEAPNSFATSLRATCGRLADRYRSLRAVGRSPLTIDAYRMGLSQFIGFCAAQGMPLKAGSITREHIEHWLADLAEQGKAPATRNKRYMVCKVFFTYCEEEGEIAAHDGEDATAHHPRAAGAPRRRRGAQAVAQDV